MQAYIRDRVEDELRPLLVEIAEEDENLVLYIDDVILTTLTFTVETVFQRIIDFGFGDITGKQALREACSSICMKLFGRSLVVTYDVLMAFAMAEVSTQFASMADGVDDPGGIADQLAQLPGVQGEREFIAEVLEDTLDIAAQVFTPLPDATRARIRNLLYVIIDSVPPNPGDDWLEDLTNNPAIQGATYEAMLDLTTELGGILAENLMQFLSLVLIKVAEKALEILSDYVEAGADQIEEWLDELAATAQALYNWFLSLPQQFAALAAQIEAAIDEALADVTSILNLFANNQRRQALVDAIEAQYQKIVETALTKNLVYQNAPDLPSFNVFGVKTPAKSDITAGFAGLIASNVVDVFVQPILDFALAPLASAQLELLDDVRELVLALRDIDSSQNITAQVTDVVLDWLANQVREAFGGKDPGMELNLFGIDLGFVGFPLDDLVATVKSVARNLAVFETLVRHLVDQLQTVLEGEEAEAALHLQEEAERIRQQEVEMMLSESQLTNLDVLILEPSASAEYRDDLEIEVFLENVPRSYLGLGEATLPRVFVLLNDEQLDLAKFTVEEQEITSGIGVPSPESVAAEILSIMQGLEEVPTVTSGFQDLLPDSQDQHVDKSKQGMPALTRRTIHTPGDNSGLFGQFLEVDRGDPDSTGQSYHDLIRRNMTDRISERRTILSSPLPNSGPRLRKTRSRSLTAPQAPKRQMRSTQVSLQSKMEKTKDLMNRPGRVRLTSHTPKTRTSGRTLSQRVVMTDSESMQLEATQINESLGVDTNLVGQILTVKERDAVLSDIGSGLILRRRIPIEELREGINTLSVGVANGATVIENGQSRPFRLQEAVSFIVTPIEGGESTRHPIAGDLYNHLPESLRDALRRDERLGRSDSSPRQPRRGKEEDRPQANKYRYALPPRAIRDRQCQQGVQQMRDSLTDKVELLKQYSEAVKQNELNPTY
jgi:hypothetical protein